MDETLEKITLYWNHIKYDIDQETFKAAKVQIMGDENAEVRNEAQTGEAIFDVYYCKRKVEEALVGVKHILHRFFATMTRVVPSSIPGSEGSLETGEENSDKFFKKTSAWELYFVFDGRRAVNADALAHEIHKYVVLNVLQEWSKIAMPTMEKNYYERLIAEENRIKAMCFRKEEPILSV